MQKQYGVVWREGERPLATGKLEFTQRALRLDGLCESEVIALEVPYAGLGTVQVGRLNGDRVNGRPSVVVERRGQPTLKIAVVAEPGAVGEIVERLSVLRSAAEDKSDVPKACPVVDQCTDVVALLLQDVYSRRRGSANGSTRAD